MPEQRAHGSSVGELTRFLLTDSTFWPDDDIYRAGTTVFKAALFHMRDRLFDLLPVGGRILVQDDDDIAEYHRPAADGHELLARDAIVKLRPPCPA